MSYNLEFVSLRVVARVAWIEFNRAPVNARVISADRARGGADDPAEAACDHLPHQQSRIHD